MTIGPKPWCDRTDDFPVVATVLGVAGCFGEALFQKYFAPGRSVQIALALMEAVPLGLLVRYLVLRSRKPDPGVSHHSDRVPK